ncbi:MAG: hypothetical protein AB7V46_05790 [Thermomicrobiales bacterium]
MNSLDSLAASSTELSAHQLDQVDGGLLPLILVLAAFDIALWGYILS